MQYLKKNEKILNQYGLIVIDSRGSGTKLQSLRRYGCKGITTETDAGSIVSELSIGVLTDVLIT